MISECIVLSGWATDFVRAYLEKPFLIRTIIRLLMGKYACRELDGMIYVMEKAWSGSSTFGYDLKDIDYNKYNDVWWLEIPPFII